MLVAPIIGKDGDGAAIMQPLVVSRDIVARIPQVDLPRAHRDGECAAVRDEFGAFFRVAGVGRGAQGLPTLCQALFTFFYLLI